ncbi:unnamed protein product [Acanthoscelides obtectus]|uniref:Uncharacterized protein n=1 Tax=Acanthoscelides obtectus TaxID=200917 RepID=A0A9P0PCJ7_ACAOB|nr:unnamed protein product [Acanthoscelides obtectus]CAK1667634.1 hypothetical protein AOBTE_LOCUS25957 [Acanthoscelides obtectus]
MLPSVSSTWIDIKKNSKSRLADRKKYQSGTGGGLPPRHFDNVEDKIMEQITPVCVTGNENVPDPFVLEEMPHKLDYDYCGDLEEDTDMAIEVGQADVASTELKDINASQATSLESLNPVLNTGTSVKRPHKRVNKTMRLTESIKNNKRFLQLTEESMKSTKNYQTEKLKILKSYYETKPNIVLQCSYLLE